jgi:hypothetical protein
MSNVFKFVFTLTCFICFHSFIIAQEVIRNKPCDDSTILLHIDSVKALKLKEGFKVVREASLSMENEYEMPVIVPLNANQWYHIVFVGTFDSKLLEVRMYDWQERQVAYKRSKNDNIVDGNGPNSSVIAYDYFPGTSEYHMIKPVQVNKKKKKNLCGYIMLLKKVEEATPPATDSTEKKQ